MWLQGMFPPEWWDMSIQVKELLPIYLAFMIWHKHFPNSKIMFLTDNSSVSYCLRKQTSQDKVMMSMIRPMVVTGMLHNIVFSSRHVEGRYNVIPDLLSRFQTERALAMALWLAREPILLPTWLLPWSPSQPT